MRAILGDRLPAFTAEERQDLRGSADFFGLNSYAAGLAHDAPNGPDYGTPSNPFDWAKDFGVRPPREIREQGPCPPSLLFCCSLGYPPLLAHVG